MNVERRILAFFAIFLLLLASSGVLPRNLIPKTSAFDGVATLTGKVYDSAIDADGDGLWDFLEIGVEINVTEEGEFIVCIHALSEKEDGDYRYLWFYVAERANASVGINVINLTLSGSYIAYSHFNPTNVSSVYLFASNGYQIHYVYMMPLSRRYNWTEFDPPQNDMQYEFVVYPDATIDFSGAVAKTFFSDLYVYPQPMRINATVEFSKDGNFTVGLTNGSLMLPENLHYYGYPHYYSSLLNLITINFASQYYNGLLNANLNATMQLPPEASIYPYNSSSFALHGTYEDGALNVNLQGNTMLPPELANQIPLNVTDVTVMLNFEAEQLNGNITFHALSGLPIGDVTTHISGNRQEITFSGYVNVIYGNWYGTIINETTLEEMLTELNSTVPGRGPESLYNITMGTVECTMLNTNMTSFPPYGARVDYAATVRGNFSRLLAYLLMHIFGGSTTEPLFSIIDAALNATLSSVDHVSLLFNYYHGMKMGFLDLNLTSNVTKLWSDALRLIPPLMPPELANQTEAILKIANVTAYAVETANLDIEYSNVTMQLNVHTSLATNITKIKEEALPLLPYTVPPQFKDLVEACVNTTYCTLQSLNVTCSFANNKINFDAEWLVEGDFTSEINHLKSCYVQYLNITMPWMVNWQWLLLNATKIDLSNFKAELRQEKLASYEYRATIQFENLIMHCPKDEIDQIRFKLYRLFNMSNYPYESPREFEKQKITIIGASSGNQTVLLYAPSTVPPPDYISSDYKVIMWENTSLSSLRDLEFNIAYQHTVDYYGTHQVPIFTNSTIQEITLNPDPTAPSIIVKVSGPEGSEGFCNITIPRSLINAPMGSWVVKIDGVALPPENYSIIENADHVIISLKYVHSEHTIEIVGMWIAREFSSSTLILLILLGVTAIVIAAKYRRKFGEAQITRQSRCSLESSL